MDPKHLVQLATILEAGSLSKASAVLHLTQPTLTHNMQALEARAGGRLFERSRFGVRSTALGEVLAREGRAINRRLRDASEACARHGSGMRHTLRLGMGPLIGAALVPTLLPTLQRAEPRLAVTIQTDRPHLLLDQLMDGRHDFVIAPSWLDKPPPGVERFLLAPDHIAVFCARRHPLAAGGWSKAAAGTQQPAWLAMGTASPFDQNLREMLREAGMAAGRTEVALTGDSFMLLRTLAAGAHLCVLPRLPMQTLGPQFDLIELAAPIRPRERPIYLWCRSAVLEDPVYQRLKVLVVELEQFRTAGATIGFMR